MIDDDEIEELLGSNFGNSEIDRRMKANADADARIRELESENKAMVLKLHTATNLLRLWAGSVDDRTVLNEFDRQLLDETVALTEAPK